MNNARIRFAGLLEKTRIEETTGGKWLMKLFDRLQPDYTPGKCLGGHDMNTHVLFMAILAVEMLEMLEEKFCCNIGHLLGTVLLHNLDRVFTLKDPDYDKFRANVDKRLEEELEDCPFDSQVIADIRTALANHSKKYDEAVGSQLQRRLQQLDMISRFHPICLMVAAAHHGSVKEFVDLNKPWLEDLEPAERFGYNKGSVYQLLLGTVLYWYNMIPEEVRPLADRYLPAYIDSMRSMGPLIAQITNGPNRVEDDIRLALGSYYERFRKE